MYSRIEFHHHGHWAKDCPEKQKCDWCGSAEHPFEECPKSGKSFSGETKRSSAAAPLMITLRRSGTAAPKANAANSRSSGFSYAIWFACSPVETTTCMAIGLFVNSFKGYGNQDFESQLRRVDDQLEEERRWFEKRIVDLAAKRKDLVKNQKNAVKLSNLLAQLKEVQQDLDDSSHEMAQSTPSSFTVSSSNVKIEIKTENAGVDKVDERVSIDSGGSAASTHPVSAIADIAGVGYIGCSGVSEGSAVGTHPVSAAAEGGNRRVEDAGTLCNSNRRNSSSSPDKNSQNSNLDW